MEGIIYKYTNKINGKVYIGQTIHEINRINNHKCSKNKDYFHNAIRKYGWNSFEYKVLFRINCSNKQDLFNTLNIKEIIAIKYFNSSNKKYGYNSTIGGLNGSAHVSNKTKDKLRRIAISNNSIKYVIGKNNRKVCQFSISGDFIKEWDRIIDASSCLNINNPSGISSCCKEKYATCGGFIWRYSDELDKNKTLTFKKECNIELFCKKIIQLDLDGKFIKEWKNVKQASTELKLEQKLIIRCAKLDYKKVKSINNKYIFVFSEDYDVNKDFSLNSRKIVQLKLDDSYVKTWDSVKVAKSSLNINDCIFRAILTESTAGGYKWKYKSNYKSKKNKRRIVQLSLLGEIINIWDDISDLPKSFNHKYVQRACRTVLGKSGGYIWIFEDLFNTLPNDWKNSLIINKDKNEKKNSYKRKEFPENKYIYQISTENLSVIKIWKCNSLTIDNVMKFPKRSIERSVRSKKSFNGFYWIRKSELDNYKSIKECIDFLEYTNKSKNKVKVIQLSIDGEFIKEWESVSDAERKVRAFNIAAVCNNKRYTSGGFKWMYAEDYYGKKEGN